MPRTPPPNYVGYVKRSCYYLVNRISWETKDVTNIAASLNLLDKCRIRLPNFTRINIAEQLREEESRDGVFPHLAFVSFLFALRVPSETMPLRRAFLSDELVDPPMTDRARSAHYLVPRRMFGWCCAGDPARI